MKKLSLCIITFLLVFMLFGLETKTENIQLKQEAIELKLIVDTKVIIIDDLESYRVYYELDGGSNAVFNPRYFTANDLNVELLGAIKENYWFAGWYTEASFSNQITEITTLGDITIYAKFEPIA